MSRYVKISFLDRFLTTEEVLALIKEDVSVISAMAFV